MIWQYIKVSLGNKIALIYAILGFLSLIILNLIWLFPSLNEIKTNAANLQLEIAKRGAVEIKSFINHKISALENLGYFLELETPLERKNDFFNKFLQNEQTFFELTLLDKKGQEQLKVSQFNIFTQADFVDQSSSDYFISAVSGLPFVSRVFFSKEAEPFLVLAIPIYSSEKEITGVLTANLKLMVMGEIISGLKIGASSRAFIVDEKGRLIADPNPSLVLKNIILIDLAPVRKIIEQKIIVTGLDASDVYLNEQSERVLTVGVPIERLNWGLVIERTEAEAYDGLGGKFLVFFIILFIGTAIVILTARLIAAYLIKPLRKLGQGAKIIGEGNLDFRLDVKSGDEIEELAESFNEMAIQLKNSYDFLERKVALRTQEIESQRDQLDKTAKKLIQRDVVLSEVKQQQEKALAEATEAKKRAEQARIATLNVLEDINDARRAQAVEKNKVEAVLLSLTDGLMALNKTGEVSLINSCAEEFLGIKKKDVISKRLVAVENQSVKNIALLMEKNNADPNDEAIILEQDKRILEITSAPVIDNRGEVSGQLIILHDVTREKAIEKMKSEFVSIVAHQLRTPLSAIKWTLRLVLDQDMGPISGEQAEILQKGYQSNERMINLVNDLLNVARIEEGRFIFRFTQTPFVGLIKETIDNLQSLIKIKNVAVKFNEPKGGEVEVMVDQEKIKLVVQNLIENALNYSLAGSCVTISLKYDKIGLVFSAADKGMGVPKDQQSRLYTKFFRGNNAVRMETEGTGLGLFIVKNIVESHGGKVWFESEEGKGSTFYFSLPLNK